MNMKDAYIVIAVRTAVGKAFKGSLRNTRPDEMAATVIKFSAKTFLRSPKIFTTPIQTEMSFASSHTNCVTSFRNT